MGRDRSLVALAVSALAASALYAEAELLVVRADSPIAVDGRLEEHAYVGYDWSQPFVVFDRENAVTNALFEPVGKPFSDLRTKCGDPDNPKTKASHAFYGARLAKRIDQNLKSWTNPYKGDETQWLPRYLAEFDVLAPCLPLVNIEDAAASEKYARSGREIWSYTVLQKMSRPAQYRAVSWKHLLFGFDGPAGFYDLFASADDPFSSYDAGGAVDYGAVYKDNRTGSLSPSLRLEAWYQGHIELRLVRWCRDRIAGMKDSAKAAAFKNRLDALVKRGAASRPDYDAIARELLELSEDCL